MAIAQVAAFGPTSGSGGTLALTGITCAAGNVLVIDVLAVNTGNTPISVTGVTDNTAGSLKNSYQVPPGAHFGAFFSGQNQFALVATILCQIVTALSANTVTVTFSTSAGFSQGESATYSGLSGGLFTVAAAQSSLLTTASSAASPSAISGPNNLVIAVANVNGAASSASGGFALRPDNMSAWLGTTSAATAATTFTLTASDPVWGTTIVAFGPVPVPQAPRRRALTIPLGRRGRTTLVPPAQLAVPPAYPFTGIAQHRQVTPRGLPRRGRLAAAVPDQPQAYTETVQRRQAWPRALPRRSHVTLVVPAQLNPPYPFAEIRQQRRPRGLLPRRGRGFSPVPAQQAAAVAPPFTWQPLRHARLVTSLRRRQPAVPVPAQAALPQAAHRSRLVAPPTRRGRVTAAHPGQHEAPRKRAAIRRRPPLLRRGHVASVPPAPAGAPQAPSWVQSHRAPARLLALIPRRFRQLMPWPQATAPVTPPSPGTLTAQDAALATMTSATAAEATLTASTQSTRGPS